MVASVPLSLFTGATVGHLVSTVTTSSQTDYENMYSEPSIKTCCVGSVELVVYWRRNCSAKAAPFGPKINTSLNLHQIVKILTTALLILCNLQDKTHHKHLPLH